MTLLIKNVQILCASEDFKESRDVFISGDKISAIGSFPNKKADEVIEGQSAYLSPGFIDVNTSSDHYLCLFDNPSQEDFLKQGVTTIIGGMCGSSLAPLLYGGLESVQKWGNISKVNVGWHTIKEFLDILDKKPLAVNFATLIGHSTIRRDIVGDSLRSLTKNELEVLSEMLRRGLKEGGFGLSTGLAYVHSRETPYSEIKHFAQITKEFNGVYATHLRKSGKEIGESVKETIKITKETGVKTLISHFMPLRKAEKEYETALLQIENLPSDFDFHFDVYPYDTSILALYTFLPLWVQNGGAAVMIANIKDEWLQPKIEKDLPLVNPDDFVVAQAPINNALVGLSLREIANLFNAPNYRTALLRLMISTELKAVIFYKNINSNLIKRVLASPKSLIATNAASFSESHKEKILKPERAASAFTKFLNLVLEDKIMPLEEAIRKITFEPARKFGLAHRGLIKEGYFADFAAFKDGQIKFVVVNGVVTIKDGAFQNKFPGKSLRHNA